MKLLTKIILFLAISNSLIAEESAGHMFYTAEAAAKNGHYREALKCYDSILKKQTVEKNVDLATWSGSKLGLARCLMHLGHYVEAKKHLDHLLGLELPIDFQQQHQLLLAELAMHQQNPQEAYRILRAWKRQVPLKFWPRHERTMYLGLQQTRGDACQKLYEEANLAFKKQDWQLACKNYLALLQEIDDNLCPQNDTQNWQLEIKMQLAQISLWQNQCDKAIGYLYQDAVSFLKNPDVKDFSSLEEVLFLLASCYAHQGKKDLAESFYSSYIQLESHGSLKHLFEAHLELGLIYFGQKKWEEASLEITKSLQDDLKSPVTKNAQLNLALIAIKQQKLQLAEERLDNLFVSPKDPLYHSVLYTKSLLYFSQKKLDLVKPLLKALIDEKSSEYFDKALVLQSRLEIKEFKQTQLQWHLKEATNLLLTALNKYPNNEKARYYLAKAALLKNEPVTNSDKLNEQNAAIRELLGSTPFKSKKFENKKQKLLETFKR
ncbi:MAG: tetratricopeptide repeat protein [Parachlamydiales bacterium]|nr:tetratricopeptide repeat protein [Parachlamydiales bacterium]